MTKALFIFLCIAVLGSCSTYHIYTKEEAIKVAKKRDIKKDGSIVIEDDNRILKVLTRDSSYQKLDEIYQFNDDGKQLKYSVIASCDSCFQKYFLKEINNDGYKWKKLNDSTYISKYNLKCFLNVHKATFSFDIAQHHLSRNEYENLIKIAEN
jgi:hypothetical protein